MLMQLPAETSFE